MAGAEYEQTLLVSREVFLYRVPPLSSASGYRCAEWGLEAPLLTASLRLLATGSLLYMRLHKQDGSVFAETERVEAKDTPKDRYLTPASDSSRYFVVRLFNAKTKQRAALGMGFRERSAAFDLHAAIDDFVKKARRQAPEYAGAAAAAAEEDAARDAAAAAALPEIGSLGLGLGEGETIRVKIAGKEPKARKPKAAPGSVSLQLSGPPAAGDGAGAPSTEKKKKHKKHKKHKKKDASEAAADDWGDFEDAPAAATAEAADDWGAFQ